MNIPSWYEFLLLGLAAWSIFHLLAHDDLLNRPRRKILRLGDDWQKEGDPMPDDYRMEWALFLTCPYCAGMWIWGGWLVAWWIWPVGVLPVAVLFGGRGLVVGFQKLLGKDEDKDSSSDAKEVADAIHTLARKQAVRNRS
jgi:hypothetical protein